ncbi:MAG: cellobiose phosphorylase [bacterium]|nr:cellobiose phosphorylase [bacterium]
MSERFHVKFIRENGDFELENPQAFKRLYFPLLNESGLISSITPDLKGDIKTGQHAFLTLPVSVEDLYLTKSSRNFWVLIDKKEAWSAAGISCLGNREQDRVKLRAGLLWHRVVRENKKLRIKAEITNFVPCSREQVEIMMVSLTNTSKKTMTLSPFFSLPLFCRSAENLRDHRNVTSMLNRVRTDKHGVVCKPVMLFNEAGHKLNHNYYFVHGYTGDGLAPLGFFPTIMEFLGETGDFERPEAVLKDKKPSSDFNQGEENAAAVRFRDVRLEKGASCRFVMIMGITDDEKKIHEWSGKFSTGVQADKALEHTKAFWQEYSKRIEFRTPDKVFNNWIKWVSVQPLLRKIAGNSFLPDFDYGKGGRGWRDLWQDLLALILVNPESVKESLEDNFEGVRVDGSNATVIGKRSGEFIADRNNVTRVWMDHGVWPFYTVLLYIHQTGDLSFLFRQQKYFKDMQTKRAREKDTVWKESDGRNLRTERNEVYSGTVVEHILVQHLVAFFNVGAHNNIRLEDADWNDGLDMANKKGESVAFTAFYYGNLSSLAGLLEKVKALLNITEIEIFEELKMLLDTLDRPVDYNLVEDKQTRLEEYLEKVKYRIKGVKIQIPLDSLVLDLKQKAGWMREHIRKNEWIKDKAGLEWFNGYYDNDGNRVEGDHHTTVRMTLTGQVFPIMFGIADKSQTERSFKAVMKYLWDKELNGLRLNTDFKDIQLNLGRAFSFAYGHKENGAFFSHMNVMMANALYHQDFIREGNMILSSIYRMWKNFNASRIYPGLPEYFNLKGRGYYHYLTGSASWYIFTMLTLVYGIRGELGDLILSPRLVREQFNKKGEAFGETVFAGKRIRVIYKNSALRDFPRYRIKKININGKDIICQNIHDASVRIERQELLKTACNDLNLILVTLD